jgi:hypothetical protein
VTADVELPAPPRRERRVVPVLGVVAVVGTVLFGGYVVAGALSEPAGPPVDVAGVLRVAPLSGWELAGRFSNPAGVRLTRGSGNLDAAEIPFDGSSSELLHSYVDEVLARDASHLSISSVEPVTLRSGLRGSRIAYVGTFGDVQTPIEGRVSAFVSPSGVGVVFDGWAPTGLLRYVLDDIETMVTRAEIG